MDARFIADTVGLGHKTGSLLGLLLFREHLQLACRCLLLDLAQQANQHIDQAFLSHLLMVFAACGHGLSEDRVSRLRAHVSRLPSVLQTDWYRAIRFGGLPSRLTSCWECRSGTSALTGMLAKAGLDVPDDPMGSSG